MSVQTTDYSVSEISSPASFLTSRVFIYGALVFWSFICLFPIYWTITTSFKSAVDVTQGHLIPFVDFQPDWKGWRSLGLSPDSITQTSTVRDEFFKRFMNSVIASVGASGLAIIIGSLAAYGLTRYRYHFAWFKNEDISFFFLSQLILPPVVLALPFLVLYREVGLLDTRVGLILLYTLMVLPIVIWIMRDQFNSIPVELEEAALVDGLSIWGAFFRIVMPIALPGMVAAFIALPPELDDLAGAVDFAAIDRLADWSEISGRQRYDAVHAFTRRRAEIEDGLAGIETAIKRDGMVWVSWPKKASKVATDVTEDVIRAEALKRDLVDVKVAAVNEIWSGLKLVIRKDRR
ncbi:MAG: carbohydrate ABC transporter permease [Mesorhizobium sp.]|nr:MAG: carbohydrate ABC transporter permease [Mesorhizobium sp.]